MKAHKLLSFNSGTFRNVLSALVAACWLVESSEAATSAATAASTTLSDWGIGVLIFALLLASLFSFRRADQLGGGRTRS